MEKEPEKLSDESKAIYFECFLEILSVICFF